jgi:protein O-GlcNAc transferase
MINATAPRQTLSSMLREAETLRRCLRLDRAEALYHRIIKECHQRSGWRSGYFAASAEYHLGNLLEESGRIEEAARHYEAAASWSSAGQSVAKIRSAAYNSLGNLLVQVNDLQRAWRCYEEALAIRPDPQIYVNLCLLFQTIGWNDDALEACRLALTLDPFNDDAKLLRCTSHLRAVYADTAEADRRRHDYEADLTAISDAVAVAPPEARVKIARALGFLRPFYLPYQGRYDRDLQEIYGNLVCQVMAERCPQYSRPLAMRPRGSEAPIRVGFVSSSLMSNHSVWKIPTKGWAENLDRRRFLLFGYCTDEKRRVPEEIASTVFPYFRQGARSLEEWCAAIVEDELDVLIYVEFGMDVISPPLGALRLAPIQIATWAHPVTSGMPTIDYFLSSELMEPESGQDHYTETLIRLPNLSFHYRPDHAEAAPIAKSDLGVAEDEVLFWCCQSLFKYVPEHDDVFPRIAREVGRCRFVFNPRRRSPPGEVFKDRIKRSFSSFGLASEDFCIFRHDISNQEFMGICAIADVYLDSLAWSGCNTTFEALAYDVPTVTLPGEFMRGRHTTAILRMMNLEEAIARDKSDYVRIAVRLGREPAERRRLSALIAERKHQLFGDLAPVRALEDFLWTEVESRRAAARRSESTSHSAQGATNPSVVWA